MTIQERKALWQGIVHPWDWRFWAPPKRYKPGMIWHCHGTEPWWAWDQRLPLPQRKIYKG